MPLQIVSSTTSQSEQLIREFLQNHHSGVIATSSASAIPHAAAIYINTLEDLSFVFVTKTATQKYVNITENNNAAFVAYNEDSQSTLQISGMVEVINDEQQQQDAINHIHTLSAEISKVELPPIEKLLAGEYAVLRFVPQTIRLAVYARPDSEGDDLFETLHFEESQ